MRRSLRGGGGTETARPLDVGRMGRALVQPGIDPRHWVSYGTVCTINADGTPNYTDEQAVYVDADGCKVDVLLSPTMQHVTARYPGVQGGATGTIYTPIRPGDEVLVEIPEGSLAWPPVITRILSGEHSRLPMNPDRTPIWQNDRILVHGRGVKVQVMAEGAGAGQVNALTDGTVTLGADTATEQLVKGTTYRDNQATLHSTLVTLMQAAATACHAATSPATVITACQAIATMLDGAVTAINRFEGQSDAYLSTVSKTE